MQQGLDAAPTDDQAMSGGGDSEASSASSPPTPVSTPARGGSAAEAAAPAADAALLSPRARFPWLKALKKIVRARASERLHHSSFSLSEHLRLTGPWPSPQPHPFRLITEPPREQARVVSDVYFGRQATVVLRVTGAEARALKEAAAARLPPGEFVSTNDALMAYMWALARAARGRAADKDCTVVPGHCIMARPRPLLLSGSP